MPNNLVFNKVASQLQTLINGVNGSGTATPILTDDTGKISITATNLDIRHLNATDDTVTVTATNLDIRDLSYTTDSVTVTATNLDIRNLNATDDTVTVTATNFDIRHLNGTDDTVTVTATNFAIRDLSYTTDSVTVTATNLDIRNLNATDDTVTVTATNFDIRDLSYTSDSVTVGAYTFTTDSVAFTAVDDDAVAMVKDTSQKSLYSFYVSNTGGNALTVKLQISPTDVDGDYLDDATGNIIIPAGGKAVLTPDNYLQYTRLYYLTPAGACTFKVYYNARI